MKFTILTLIVVLATYCLANEDAIEYAKIRPVSSLSGTVIDQTGTPIPQVQVLEMSADGKTVLRSTTTDAQGRWTFQPTPGRNTYQVHFSKGGFHQVWMNLRLTKRHVKPLSVKMPVA